MILFDDWKRTVSLWASVFNNRALRQERGGDRFRDEKTERDVDSIREVLGGN